VSPPDSYPEETENKPFEPEPDNTGGGNAIFHKTFRYCPPIYILVTQFLVTAIPRCGLQFSVLVSSLHLKTPYKEDNNGFLQ